MSFNPDTAWMDPKYDTTSTSNDIKTRAAALKRRKRPVLSLSSEAAEAMENESSLDPRKSCTGMFCGAVKKLKFWGGKRRTKKRRKKRRTKSRRKTKRRRKSRRRTKRRRRKR